MIEVLLLIFFALCLIPFFALIVTDIEYEKYLKEKYKYKTHDKINAGKRKLQGTR